MKKTATAKAIDYAAVIDEAGRLDAELAAVEPKRARLKLLKEIIAARAGNLQPEESPFYDGEEFSALVSAIENETAISDMEAVFRMLGKPKFLDLCSMTLKNLREHLTTAQFAIVTKKARTGSRSVKLLSRAG
jgi:hypothetical protein